MYIVHTRISQTLLVTYEQWWLQCNRIGQVWWCLKFCDTKQMCHEQYLSIWWFSFVGFPFPFFLIPYYVLKFALSWRCKYFLWILEKHKGRKKYQVVLLCWKGKANTWNLNCQVVAISVSSEGKIHTNTVSAVQYFNYLGSVLGF